MRGETTKTFGATTFGTMTFGTTTAFEGVIIRVAKRSRPIPLKS